MEFKLSKHAAEQMTERSISPELVQRALDNPFSIVLEDGLDVYQLLFKQEDKHYLLRVYANTEKLPPVIVTVYLTSKIQKYLQ